VGRQLQNGKHIWQHSDGQNVRKKCVINARLDRVLFVQFVSFLV